MTFDVWWQNIIKTCEVPRTAPFYSLAKILADSAWKRGSEEGAALALRVLRDHDADAGKEAKP